MSKLKFGVIGTSRKENERRFPIHPEHFSRIPDSILRQLIFEKGYGAPFGISDLEIAAQTGGIATRSEILSDIGLVIIAKPVLTDLLELREGGTLWGYVHCVQQKDITQAALDRKLTLIAFEDMYVWSPTGHIGRHTFYKNNEMAGYCAVIHALQLKGIDGHYGNQRKTIIFGLVRSVVVQYTPLRPMALETLLFVFSVKTMRFVKKYLIVTTLRFKRVTRKKLG